MKLSRRTFTALSATTAASLALPLPTARPPPADGTTPAGPGDVQLTLLGSAAGGVEVRAVLSPGV
ncbi:MULTISPECIES: hypothetical protein [unclassified Streptomyces]|uniref:hypothetical protein n=1 Tax=unclassified Streptomyces TaxID=2593676 RepID=UPI0036E1671D